MVSVGTLVVHTLTWCPCALKARAVARPPMLPPAMRTVSPPDGSIGAAIIFSLDPCRLRLDARKIVTAMSKSVLDNRVERRDLIRKTLEGIKRISVGPFY